MKYQLLPLDPDLDPVDFDTQSILDLARLGPYDKDAGVVYFDGVACLEPRPDKTTMGHVRRLEAELLTMKAERDRLLDLVSDIDELLAEWKNLDYINYGKMKSTFDTDLEQIELRIEDAIAAAKGES